MDLSAQQRRSAGTTERHGLVHGTDVGTLLGGMPGPAIGAGTLSNRNKGVRPFLRVSLVPSTKTCRELDIRQVDSRWGVAIGGHYRESISDKKDRNHSINKLLTSILELAIHCTLLWTRVTVSALDPTLLYYRKTPIDESKYSWYLEGLCLAQIQSNIAESEAERHHTLREDTRDDTSEYEADISFSYLRLSDPGDLLSNRCELQHSRNCAMARRASERLRRGLRCDGYDLSGAWRGNSWEEGGYNCGCDGEGMEWCLMFGRGYMFMTQLGESHSELVGIE
ncbi:hypothetical protein Tco_0666282 [Tanacetum coccineum]